LVLRIHNTDRESVLLQKKRSSYFSRNKPSLPQVTVEVWQAGLDYARGVDTFFGHSYFANIC
jgi:hypothetical protein